MIHIWAIKISFANGRVAILERQFRTRPTLGEAALLIKDEVVPDARPAVDAESDGTVAAMRLLGTCGIHIVGIRRHINTNSLRAASAFFATFESPVSD